jgi:hypothetical protein
LYSIPTLQKLHTQKSMPTVQSANCVAASHQPPKHTSISLP